MNDLAKNINALIILVLAGILLAAFGVQIFEHEVPCPLCLLQRIGMLAVAASLTLNLYYGIKPAHYGLGLLASLYGGAIALRQISLHVCPQFPKFGLPVFGVSLYTWSFFIFASSVLAIALLLFLYDPRERDDGKLNRFSKLSVYLIVFVAIANLFYTWFQCGFGSCE